MRKEERQARERKSSARYRAKNREAINTRVREYQRKKNGMTSLPAHPEPSLCECCGAPPKGKRRKRLVPDHCHAIGAPRGWICQRCNWKLGLLGDELTGIEPIYRRLLKHDLNRGLLKLAVVEQLYRYLFKYSTFNWIYLE